MRAVVLTEEIMGVALKFTRKSTNMGSLLVSWDPAHNSDDDLATSGIKNRKQFRRRVQATFTICLGLIFTTMFVFFVCALDSSANSPISSSDPAAPPPRLAAPPSARESMRKMGVFIRAGTKSMSNLVMAHVPEDLTRAEMKLFIRMIHRSGVMAHSDLVLIFPGHPIRFRGGEMAAAILEEDRDFNRILAASGCPVRNNNTKMNIPDCGGKCCGGELSSNSSISSLNLGAYEQEMRAKMAKLNRSSGISVPMGSIKAYDVGELDPTDTLSGFIDRPPIQLRRWICYQMLLGIVRKRYNRVLATAIRGVYIADDAMLARHDAILGRHVARRHKDDGRSLVLVEQERSWLEEGVPRGNNRGGRRHHTSAAAPPGLVEGVYGRSVWEAIEPDDMAGWAIASGAVVTGGVRGVRSLADAMATEIARVAMLRRSKAAFGDAAAINYVVRRNVGVLGQKVVDKMAAVGRRSSGAAVHSLAAPPGVIREAFEQEDGRPYSIVIVEDFMPSGFELRTRLGEMVMQDLCSSPLEAAIYTSDCGKRLAPR